jgi:uncharacterized protein YggE
MKYFTKFAASCSNMRSILQSTILSIALLTSCNAFGQNQPPQSERRQPYIEKTGTASKEVVPDQIEITVTICERIEEDVKTGLDIQEKQLKEKLAATGIDMNNMTVSNFGETYIEEKHFLHKKQIVLQQKSFLITVRDVASIDKVFAVTDELKVKYADIHKVEYSKKDELVKELRVAAVKDAKEQAEYMMGAAGESVGKTMSIKDNISKRCRVNRRDEARAGSTSDPADKYFTKLTYTVKVYMKFAIK